MGKLKKIDKLDRFYKAIDEVIPRMSIVKSSEIFNIYSVLVSREINGRVKTHNVLFDTPTNITRAISPAENLINNFEGQTTSNDPDHDRKLWTYEENRKFLEASQKFGLDYKKIQAYVRTRSVKQVKNKMLNLKATLKEQIFNTNLNSRKSSNDSLGSNNIIEMKKIPATK
jgi:hypothetical protein